MITHKNKLVSLAALIGLLVSAPAAFAQVFNLSFTSGGVSAYGSVSLTAGVATAGSITITGAALNGVFALVPVPAITNSGPGVETISNPNGDFVTFDNLTSPSANPALNSNGLAFASGYLGLDGSGRPEYESLINLWGNGPGSYSLFEGKKTNTEQVYVTYNGTADFQAIPEPSTYAAILGTAALGFVAMRRRRAA
jgi:hypothetical protein